MELTSIEGGRGTAPSNSQLRIAPKSSLTRDVLGAANRTAVAADGRNGGAVASAVGWPMLTLAHVFAAGRLQRI